jgi:hypothetical protein
VATFTELQTDIMDRLNYTSSASQTRVGRLINKIHREVTSSIGLNTSRHGEVYQTVTIGSLNVTFSGIEQLDTVWYFAGSSTTPRVLDEVLPNELRQGAPGTGDAPTKYAIYSQSATTVTLRLDKAPSTAYTLWAAGTITATDLSGSAKPLFPEDYHDVIIEGVLKDEYQKLEKYQAADRAEARFQRRLSDLRMFMTKKSFLDIQQGKFSSGPSSISGSSGGGTASQNLLPGIAVVTTYGTVGDGTTDDTVAINAALSSGYGTIFVPAGTYKTTSSLIVGADSTSVCLWLAAGAEIDYQPTSGTDPAVKLYYSSSIMGESRESSVITVSRDGCSGIVAQTATFQNNKPYLDGFSIYDEASTRTSGNGVTISLGYGVRGSFSNLEISGFYDGFAADQLFSSSFSNVNPAGSKRDGFHITGSGTSLSFVSCYANNTVRHGFYFDGLQEYCSLHSTSADIGYDSTGGSGYAYYLDRVSGDGCKAFTFNSIACEVSQYALGGVYCEEGQGHVFNAPELLNTFGTGTNNGITFAGSSYCQVNRGYITGWRGVAAGVGHDYVAILSGRSTTPSLNTVLIARDNLVSFPTQNGRFYAPSGGIDLVQKNTDWTSITLLNSWVNDGGTSQTAQYMRDANGTVHVRGIIKNGTAADGTPLFTLAAGFRPDADEYISVMSNNEWGSVLMLPSGVCQFHRGTNTQFGIQFTFRAAALALNSQNPA